MIQACIRKAQLKDLGMIKTIADAHRKELGFVRRPVIEYSIEQGEIFVAEGHNGLLGFMQYHHRRDKQTTLHNIAVTAESRGQGIGRALMEALFDEAKQKEQTSIFLKCPESLLANKFYFHMGLRRIAIENGKLRRLKTWRKRLIKARQITSQGAEN